MTYADEMRAILSDLSALDPSLKVMTPEESARFEELKTQAWERYGEVCEGLQTLESSARTMTLQQREQALRAMELETGLDAFSTLEEFTEDVRCAMLVTEQLLRRLPNEYVLVEPSACAMPSSLLAPLTFFRYFCDRVSREHLELVATDLKQDIVGMRAEGRPVWYVTLAVWWAILTTLVDISFDALRRRIGRILLFEIICVFRSIVNTRFDPS